ncbi:MAG: EamA family transporter, partial [Dehalococcoidia bacterium]
MPAGELAALAAAIIFSFTAIVDKFMTRRFRPITMVSLSAMGGALFALVLVFALGKTSEVPDAPLSALLLSVAGGVISIGIGFPLYVVFLRSVDVSKASPLSSGFFSLFSLLAGLLLLGEDLSPLTLVGISTILLGVYLLSIAQRKQSESKQAQWLGIKGILFLAL